MSGWASRLGGSSAPSASAYGDSAPGAAQPSSLGPVYQPTPSGPPKPPDTEERSGVVNIDLLDPGKTSIDPISQLFDGLRKATVGVNDNRDRPGFTDSSAIGGVPILGNVGRVVANAIGGVGEVAGGALYHVGGGLSRLPASYAGTGELDEAYEAAKAEAMQTENGRKLMEEFQAEMDAEKGLFGTGLFDNDQHFKTLAVRAWEEEKQYSEPSLMPGAFTAPGSMSDSILNMFDGLEASIAVVSKHWAQLDTPAQEGMDRIDLIQAVGREQAAFNEDTGILGTGILAGDPTTGLNQMEALVFAKLESGDWTRDQAADFLASNGQAFGHSALVNIGGAVALDPLNIATVGASIGGRVIARGGLQAAHLASAMKKTQALQKTLEEAEAALRLARGSKATKGVAAVKGAGPRAVREAEKVAKKAREEFTAADKSIEAARTYLGPRGPEGIRRANLLAKSIEGRESVGRAFLLAGRVNGALEGTSLGRAAKITRTIIDPFHALDLHAPGAARAVDLLSDSIPNAVAGQAGVHHYKGILDEMLRLDSTGASFDQFTRDFAVAATNMGREGVLELFRSSNMAGELGEELMKMLPNDLMETAISTTKHRDLEKWLRFNALKHVMKENWTYTETKTLAKGLAKAYPDAGRDVDGWMVALKTASKEQKSLYKFSVYGNANRRLLDFVDNMADDVADALPVNKGRMVLLAKGTLTKVGGESLLTKLTTMGKATKKKVALIEEWQERYPQLRYVSIDSANRERSVDEFVEYLKDNMERLPMQMTDDEIAKLGDKAEDLLDTVGEYSLGFRPEERFLWGLERENGTGLYRKATQAWADHVADGARPFRPANFLRLNIAGHPIVGVPVVRAAVKAVDHIDSAARLMKSQVSSAMIGELARKRFIAKAANGELSGYGVTERVASDWFERITKFTREHQGYSGPRGFSSGELYRAIKEENLIPSPLLNGERRLNPDDIMRLVLEAYDGDMRYIGLTQKLSGRAKRWLFEVSGGSNFAGQIAEHTWPTMKFRYNPIFQLQEKVEAVVLSAQRGVDAATGVHMTEADRITEGLLLTMTDNSLVRQSDLFDNFEYSAGILSKGLFQNTVTTPGTALNRVHKIGKALTEVQGMKRLNMLRTFRKGLGKELKAGYEQVDPGAWKQMKEFADMQAGRILHEDDFALSLVTQNSYANDVFVSRVAGKGGKFAQKAEWANAIKTAEWSSPTTLGELKRLDLEHVASSLHLVDGNGKDIVDLTQLRAALATDPNMMDHVIDGLTRLGASKDYIRRVRNGLNFSWNGFWKTAAKRFSLTADESEGLQAMMAEAAKLRGMNPVEFMSQVFSPSLIDGTEGILGHLEGTVRVLRDARAAGRKIKPREAKFAETRTVLAGKEGVSTRDDLVRQLSATFSAHLDPSARRALLMEFDPVLRDAVNAGTVRLDLEDVQKMWDSMAEDQLADRILGYMDGKRGSAAFDPVADRAARGVPSVQTGATKYMQDRGVTPHEDGRYYKPDDVLSERTAKAYSGMADVDYEKTGRRPTIRQIDESSTELKPKPDGVEQRAYDAYQDLVIETRAQYDHMRAPKAKGGMGLKVIVARGDPYPNSAAMRADVAKGQIRVYAGNADHPLMTNEQNVMFRAVHDVFGHAAEGFEFGPRGELNAAIKHSQMYSDTSRAAMLTETHGQNSWVNFSDDAYDPLGGVARRSNLDRYNVADDFETQHPFDRNADTIARQERMRANDPDYSPDNDDFNTVRFYGKGPGGGTISTQYLYSRTVGDGLRIMPPEYQRAILQPIHDLMQEMPDLKIKHVDMLYFDEPLDVIDVDTISGMGYVGKASALTWAGDEGEAVIIFNRRFYENMGDPPWYNDAYRFEQQKSAASFLDPDTDQEVARKSNMGTPYTAVHYSPEYISRHEAGHAFDSARRPRDRMGKIKAAPGHESYDEMMRRFEDTGSRMDLSEYGMTNSHEFGAELFAFVTDPEYDAAKIGSDVLRDMSEEMRRYLIDTGEWKPLAKAIDESLVLDNLPRPGFGRSHLFAGVGDSGLTTSGDWGAGVYLSGEASAANAGGASRVAAYRVLNDELLDLTFLLPGESVRDTIREMKNVGMAAFTYDLGDFVTELGLSLDVTGDAVREFAVQNTRSFNAVLKARRYKGFRFMGADGASGGTVVTDPSALTKVADDIYARNAPAPAAQTVREANAAKPGSVYAPQKAGLLPQDILDEFGEKFVGRGKHVESNPDVARTAQMFGKWSEAVVANGLLRGEHGVYGQLLRDVAQLPTGAAVPYNYTEGAAVNVAMQSMTRKWDDAFRLQYFAQERSFLERSLNHPMFGMYPASYMWGKIMPEMVRFLAAEPFGNKTGGLLYSLMDAQAAIALRREYDPYFDAKIEELGHSQALSFGGYLLPAVPWDMSASAPPALRSIADQGAADAERVEQGREPKGISLVDPAVSTAKKLAPLTTSIPWAGRAFDELNGETEAEESTDARDMNRAVKASELQPTMQRIMEELQEALR